MNEQADDGAIRPDEVLALTQRSARRREYELRRGSQVIGWLRFPPGRRSVALAEGDQTGPIALVASSGRVEVRSGTNAAVLIATVEPERRGTSMIRTVQRPPLRWRRTGRWHRWAIEDGDATLLRFTAAQGLMTSSVRIIAQQRIPGPAGVLLCLIGGFLALRRVRAEIDGTAAAVAGIAAATAAAGAG